jgi:hypothetical protein
MAAKVRRQLLGWRVCSNRTATSNRAVIASASELDQASVTRRAMRLDDSSGPENPLGPARGILTGVVLGLAVWITVIAIVWF